MGIFWEYPWEQIDKLFDIFYVPQWVLLSGEIQTKIVDVLSKGEAKKSLTSAALRLLDDREYLKKWIVVLRGWNNFSVRVILIWSTSEWVEGMDMSTSEHIEYIIQSGGEGVRVIFHDRRKSQQNHQNEERRERRRHNIRDF